MAGIVTVTMNEQLQFVGQANGQNWNKDCSDVDDSTHVGHGKRVIDLNEDYNIENEHDIAEFMENEVEWEDDLNEEDVKNMTFDTVDEAETFYNLYAKCLGFGIRKEDLKIDKVTGFISMRKWVCAKEGYRRNKWLKGENKGREPRALTRVGCLATLRVRFDRKQKKFIVTQFIKQHNHAMLSQDSVPFLWSHRSVKSIDVAQTRIMQDVGWRTSDIMKFFAHQAGGYHRVGFVLKDLYNFLDAERREEIKDGDAIGALAYLCAKKDSDPLFFYKYDVDGCNRLSRLFWTDSRAKSDYKIFGDVLVFDSTYRTNAYRKPLVILAGVNNHYMTTIFACALLSDETEATYVWVLETLMEAMEGKQPISVITDSDNAMKNSIEKVFPTAQHRLCCWHLQRNAATNVHSQMFCQGFVKCMNLKCTTDEFERRWEQLITESGVQNNSWVRDTYLKRSKWAEAYLRGHFWGNMNCTQRSEGMNAFLKKYLDTKLRLYEFVRSFDLALAWLRHTEARELTITCNSTPVLSTHWHDFEDQINSLCTRKIFFKVREDLKKEAMMLSKVVEEIGPIRVYVVTLHKQPDVSWKVIFDRVKLTFQCSCLQLETIGWACSHLFSVMKAEHLEKFPQKCINSRWTRNVKESIHGINDTAIPRSITETGRYGVLNPKCSQMCYYASISD